MNVNYLSKYGCVKKQNTKIFFYEGLDFVVINEHDPAPKLTHAILRFSQEIKTKCYGYIRLIDEYTNEGTYRKNINAIKSILWFLVHWRHLYRDDKNQFTENLLYNLIYMHSVEKIFGIEMFIFKIFGCISTSRNNTALPLPEGFTWTPVGVEHKYRDIEQPLNMGPEISPITILLPDEFIYAVNPERDYSDSKICSGSYGFVKFCKDIVVKRLFSMCDFIKEFHISNLMKGSNKVGNYTVKKGGILSELEMEKGHPLTFSEPTAENIHSFLVQIISSLHEFHSRGVIHRDLSMGNVLTRANSNENIIIDFSHSGSGDDCMVDYGCCGKSFCTITTRPPEFDKKTMGSGMSYFNGEESDIFSSAVVVLDKHKLVETRTVPFQYNKAKALRTLYDVADRRDYATIENMLRSNPMRRKLTHEILGIQKVQNLTPLPHEKELVAMFPKFNYWNKLRFLYGDWKPCEGMPEDKRMYFFKQVFKHSLTTFKFCASENILAINLLRTILIADRLYEKVSTMTNVIDWLAFFSLYVCLSLQFCVVPDMNRYPDAPSMLLMKKFVCIDSRYYTLNPFSLINIFLVNKYYFPLYSCKQKDSTSIRGLWRKVASHMLSGEFSKTHPLKVILNISSDEYEYELGEYFDDEENNPIYDWLN